MTKVVINPAHHRFELDLGDGEVGFAEYHLLTGDRILFPHTVVPEGHEGHGYGTKLVEAGLAYAREHGLKVVPQCPFFRAYMKRHPETRGLLDPASAHLLD
ncbi:MULTISPECIES: GNAT family N-acetyltransferase [Sphingomonas]|uniref:GNAT family N-acetyltransferase n=1 Tax=Sphingomonas TaxID=13687 RepID=UPI000DEF9099|nr:MULTISPECIES: GNAT family N-acetyltransferase [Sphingomonas]